MPPNAGLVPDGADFLKSMGWALDKNKGLITGGNADKTRHREVMEEWEHLAKVGYEVVTVVNCMPFQIENHGMAGNFHIRACDIKAGETFVAYTYDRPRMPVADKGEAAFVPKVVLPVEIGMEFARVYEEYGGVFFYRKIRTHNKDGQEVVNDIPQTELMKLVAQARERMTVWMVAQYNLGEDSWQKFNKRSDKIPPQSRDAAHFLKQEGVIDQLPEWVHTKRSTSGTKPCKWCAETIKENAIVCRFCTMRQDIDISQQNVGKARSEENDHAAPVGTIPPLQPSTPLVAEGSDGEDDGIGEDLADLDNPNAKAENKTVTKPLPKPNGKKN